MKKDDNDQNNLDIMYTILKMIKDKISFIRICFISNIPYDTIYDYVAEMTTKGFVITEKRGSELEYVVTERGTRFMDNFMEIRDFTLSFGLL